MEVSSPDDSSEGKRELKRFELVLGGVGKNVRRLPQ